MRWNVAAAYAIGGLLCALLGARAWENTHVVGPYVLVAIVLLPIFAVADRYVGGNKKVSGGETRKD